MANIARLPQNYLSFGIPVNAAPWVADNATITSNATTGPCGENDGVELTDTGAIAFAFIRQDLATIGSNPVVTLSAFFKEGSTTKFELLLLRPALAIYAQCVYEWVAGAAVVQNLAKGLLSGVDAPHNGWYRAWVTTIIIQPIIHATALRWAIRPSEGGVVQAGNVFTWGAQLNDGYAPDPILITTEVPRTGI